MKARSSKVSCKTNRGAKRGAKKVEVSNAFRIREVCKELEKIDEKKYLNASPKSIAAEMREYQLYRRAKGKYAWSDDPTKNVQFKMTQKELGLVFDRAIDILDSMPDLSKNDVRRIKENDRAITLANLKTAVALLSAFVNFVQAIVPLLPESSKIRKLYEKVKSTVETAQNFIGILGMK